MNYTVKWINNEYGQQMELVYRISDLIELLDKLEADYSVDSNSIDITTT